MTEFRLPDLGEGLHEAEIVQWHVNEGNHVTAGQPLLSVETEKAVVEIPSPHSGYVERILAHVGERARVGAPLLSFAEATPHDRGAVVGELAESKPAGAKGERPQALASPAVRSRAKALSVDIEAVTPSGPQGTVTLADVEAAAGASRSLRGARRSMALNMTRAWHEVAHATLHDTADIETWPRPEEVTLRAIHGLIAACAVEPSLNASFDAATLSLRENSGINVGIAIDSPDGLFVPVLHDAAQSGPAEWRRQIETMKQGVAARKLSPAELSGATITLSNFGIIGGQKGVLIVIPPQVAIVGLGRIIELAVRTEAGVAFHRTLPVSLTFDHRAITGGQAARFLHAFIADLERAA